VDESISLGIHWCHGDDSVEGNSAELAPRCIKCLMTYARKVCKELSIDEKPVFGFVDTGNLYLMFVDIKATLVKYEASNQTSQLQALQDTLNSNTSSLSTHLLACILSLNTTTYVTDTQHHIMEFISDHLEIFKIPVAISNNSELQNSLGKTVTMLLSDIHSHLKTHLTTSIIKKTYIMDVVKAMAHGGAGMEVDAMHWTRLAFLHCCLHLFLISTSDHRIAPLNACFTPQLIPMLKSDIHTKIEQDPGINLCQKEQELNLFSGRSDTTADDETDPLAQDGNSSTPAANEPEADLDQSGADDSDQQCNTNAEGPGDGDELDEMDSGFGLNGKPVRFVSTKFWNYVDYMLNVLHETACKTAPKKKIYYEKEVHLYMIQIFQQDLAERPGVHRGSKLVSVMNPQCQSTIQQGLVR
ncbi:hypothetical protein PAXRUDRAFT_136530, partial [Paxillus rubicundulus Ve08.2h10]